MSGQRGWIAGTHQAIIINARRELQKTPVGPTRAYQTALDLFISTTYACLGLEQPKVYRFASPLAAVLAAPAIAMARDSQSFESDLLTDLRSSITSRLGEDPKEHGRGLTTSVGSRITEALGRSPASESNELFEEHFDAGLTSLLGELPGGYRYLCHDKTVLKGTKRLNWWSDIAPSDLWLWPYRKFAILSDHPERVIQDANGRFHCENDAAVEFADGYRIWAWHGVLVPKKVILFPEALSFDHVQAEKNIEIRRIMIERIGPGKYLKGASAILLDMDTLTHEGSAPRALMKDKLGQLWLVGTDGSTGRVYTMAVPSDVTTCREAHERIAGFPENRLIAEA